MKAILISPLLASLVLFGSCVKAGFENKEQSAKKITIPSSVNTSPVLSEQGGNVTISFEAADSWTAGVINTRADSWISVEPTSGGKGQATIKITATENETFEDRNATIEIRCGQTKETISLFQKQKNDLTLTKSKFELGKEGGTVEIEVKSNIEYTYCIEGNGTSWIRYEGTKAYESRTLKFKIDENEDVEKREGSIVFEGANFKETVNIYQEGAAPTIIISQKEYPVSADGEIIRVEVRSNMNVDYKLPDNCDWVHEVTTKSMSTNTFQFSIDQNILYDNRTTEIVFSSEDKTVSESVVITQYQKDAIVLGENQMFVSAAESKLDVRIQTNVEIVAEIEEDSKEWISEVETKGLEEISKHFLISQNTTGVERRGKILFKNTATGLTSTLEVIQSSIDLSVYTMLGQTETANCYILSMPGKYCFDASVAGNGEKGLLLKKGFPESVMLSPDDVELVWCDEDLKIDELSLNGKYLLFNYHQGQGNAVVAVKNNGAIIWSWHLWATDKPKDIDIEDYVIMDRNLGAVSAAQDNTAKEIGVFYQWGRKDPFRSTIKDESIQVLETERVLEERIKHPGVFYYPPEESLNYDDLRALLGHLWGNYDGYLGGQGVKTIYDPCPAGYTVPNYSWMDSYCTYTGTRRPSELTEKGVILGGKGWLPKTGGINTSNNNPIPRYYSENDDISYRAIYRVDTYSFGLTLYDNDISSLSYSYYWGGPIRCVKDIPSDITVPYVRTGRVIEIDHTSATITGEITYNGNSTITSYGVRWGYTRSVENVVSIEGAPSQGSFSVDISGIEDDKLFYYQIFAINDHGSGTGEIASARTLSKKESVCLYTNKFYSWMVQYNTGGGRHQDFGHLGCVYTLDMYGQDIAICGTWNWGTYDINHDYGQYDAVRPYQLWNFYYTLLKKCNEVIDFFGEADPTDATLRGYLGQAYALRAFCYTYLIQIFQDPVTGTTPNAALRTDAKAVPIVYSSRDGKTVEEADEMSGRNTYADLMEEIERNIALSLPLLEGYVRGSKNEVNYSVAQGIAARYFLLTQQWDKAASAAAAAQTGFDIMDRTRLMSGFMDVEDKEVMWGFNHTTETQTSYASYFSHMSNDSAGYGGVGQSVHCIDRSLYDQIPDTDYRKELFNGPNGDPSAAQAGGKLPYAARKFGYMASWLQDYIYMRNAEMILIQAEAEARQGQNSAAAQTLGKLMAKRNPAWASANVTVDDVLLQRRIELWGEGFEYFDLRRNGLGINRKYEGTNHLASGQYAFPAHGKSWNFQIPQKEMESNPHITESDQNEWISGTNE